MPDEATVRPRGAWPLYADRSGCLPPAEFDQANHGRGVFGLDTAQAGVVAPLPVWSSNKPRHRLSRTWNRQLKAAIHRIAITQGHYHEPARQLLDRRREGGKSKAESHRVLSADYQTSSIEPCYGTRSTPRAPSLSPLS